MSNDPLPLPDVSAGLRDEPDQIPVRLARDLLDLRAAIKWIEDAAAPNQTPAPDGLAAVERIVDIAFTLREREVDAALCDALEAATREVSEIITRSKAAAEGVQSAFKLLRALAERIDTIVATATAVAGPVVRIMAAAHAGAGQAADRGGGRASEDAALAAAVPRPAPNDSLAALRALSEEELIALFS
jgi:hypothetical protein